MYTNKFSVVPESLCQAATPAKFAAAKSMFEAKELVTPLTLLKG